VTSFKVKRKQIWHGQRGRNVNKKENRNNRAFKFEASWLHEESCRQVVEAWGERSGASYQRTTEAQGTPKLPRGSCFLLIRLCIMKIETPQKK
jgi:hypothetical protein